MTAVRHPPGRGGRIWLRRRLSAARRGADLLDSKLRILRREEQRFQVLAERTRLEWEASVAEAERWLLRAALVGGQRGVRPDPGDPPADVEVAWASVMGVRYPARAAVRLAEEPARSPVAATAALPLARAAYRRALEAAVAHAVADGAARVVAAEVRTTRGRLRAIEDRWVPRLDQALSELESSLLEAETADSVRLRWVTQSRRRRAGPADREPGTEVVT
jgi:V/A-type H+-transporting ATPase subunit D